MKHNAMRLSAALAYYSTFSIAPLLVIAIALAGLVLGKEAVSGQLYGDLKGYVGPQAASAVQSMVESASAPASGTLATIIGFMTLLLGASGVFGELKGALNTIWEVVPKTGGGFGSLVRTRLLNFGMVLVIGFLLLVSLLMSTGISALNGRLEQMLPLPGFVSVILAFALSFGMVTVLFALIFKVLPDTKILWREVWIGAAITGLLFEVGKAALGWYLGRESAGSAYGAAGSVVLLLLWIYYAACILFFGAEITRVRALMSERAGLPSSRDQKVMNGRQAPESADVNVIGGHPSTLGDPAPPQEGLSAAGQRPAFSHRLVSPILKYLEGRGLLLTVEAKEAMQHVVWLVILLAIGVVTLFAGWLLLATALVGVLTSVIGWFWIKAVAITGGAHMLIAAVAGFLIWRRLTTAAWFAETLKQLKEDRAWLRGTPTKN